MADPDDTPSPVKPLHQGRWRIWLLQAGTTVWLLCVVLVLGLLAAAWVWLDPTPDRRITMATGPAQGAYTEFAKRYVPLLQQHGVTVQLRPTQGSTENLALLRDPRSGVQLAFVQGGVEQRADQPDPRLVSLGSVAYEPLWLFFRADAAERLLSGTPLTSLAQLAGWRVNVGPEGGGTAPLFVQLAAANKVAPGAIALGRKPNVLAVVDLVQGASDAVAMVSAADAPLVQYLLQTPGVTLFDFAQADAYARRFPFLRPVVLPRGVADLARDQPPQDVRLVAATASLLARRDLHPALQQLLLQAASTVHREAGWFAKGGEFPNASLDAWPLSAEAERYHRDGPPWLQRYLPYWLASFVDRMWIVVLPLLAALLPLSRVLPPLVTLRMRSRVFRWYANLRAVEQAIERPGADLAALDAELAQLDHQTEGTSLPLAYTNELYDLRSHIQLVRRRLGALREEAPR